MTIRDSATPKTQITDSAQKYKDAATWATRFISSFVFRIAEIAIAVFVGTQLGTYFTNHVVSADCQKYGTAKVGENFISCDFVQPKKDPVTVAPR